MSTRRRSVAPNPPPSLASSTKPASRRASTATFVKPELSKVSKKAPAKPVRKNVGKKPNEPIEALKENSFVAGDLFDFNGQTMLTPAKSPRGPMTRARRSSMYVAPMKNGMVTSTARRSGTKKSKASNLDSVMETPTVEESYEQPEQKINPVVESPEGEVSFKTDSMTPQMIEQQNRLLAKREGMSPARVILSPMALSPIKRVTKGQEEPAKVSQTKEIVAVKLPKKEAAPNLPLSPKKKFTKVHEKPAKVVAVEKLPIKKAPNLPLPKLTIPKKIAKVQKENMPGTPQPTDPGNLLKENLKRKVDVRMDKKLDEIPKNLSPYTLIVGETENGSPIEQFVKTKPSKENITGTPAPLSKMRQNRVLRPLDNNLTNQVQGTSYPIRKSPRLLATPKKLNMSTTEALKNDVTTGNVEDGKIHTPKLETENQAVNKALAKQKSEIVSSRSCNSTTANNGGQMFTGDLASLCLIM